jgi:peptidoglycan lytic transglycosylase G
MTRHGRRGTDGDQGQDQWLDNDYRRSRRDDARTEYRAAAWDNVASREPRRGRGAVGTSSDPGSMRWNDRDQQWDQTGPPWELPGWGDEAEIAASGHPSAPLPRVNEPLSEPTSGPLPPATRAPSSGPLPRVSQSGPLPRVSSSGPMPRVSSSGPMPRVSSSGPLPRVSSSGPMPAVDPLSAPTGEDWGAGGRSGRARPGPRSSHAGYPEDDGSYQGDTGPRYRGRHGQGGGSSGYADSDPYSGYGQPGAGYQGGEPGYPGGYQAADPGYPGGGYPAEPPPGAGGYRGEDGYPTEMYAPDAPYPGQPAPGGDPGDYQDAGYHDSGYHEGGHPGADGYHDGGEYPGPDGYPPDPRYPAGHDYPEYPAEAGYPAEGDPYAAYQVGPHESRHGGGERGYTDQGDWYEDVDDHQGWADEGYEDGFVPGLGDDRDEPAPAGRRGPDRDRGDGRGGGRAAAKRQAGKKGKKGKGALRRAAPLVAVAVLFFALCTAGGAYYWVYRNYLHPADYPGAGTGSVQVVITKNETATQVGQMLFSKGVVASVRAFSNAAKDSGRGNLLEFGTFTLHLHMKASLAFQMLLNPAARVESKVLLREGLRLSNIIAVLGKETGDLAGYKKAIAEVPQLGLPAYAHKNPQGYLFPDTYTIQHGTPPLKVLQEMVNAFNQEATKVDLVSEAAKGNITPAQVITIASLVQAEGGRTSDYPKIAEVIYNRLNQGIKLQLDSTVLFALHKYGILASNADLKVKSPYNTYANAGLPPGPIDSPGDSAIQAALHPAHGNLLYFVTVDPKNRITKFTSSPQVFAQLKAELEKNLGK